MSTETTGSSSLLFLNISFDSCLKKRCQYILSGSIGVVVCCLVFWPLSNLGWKMAKIDAELTLGLSGTPTLLLQTLSKPLMLARLAAESESVQLSIDAGFSPGTRNRLLIC